MDSSNNVLSALSLTSNPSVSTASLVFPSNSLGYGIYAITYTASLTVTSTQTVQTSSLTVYVSVVPTGYIVKGLANGVQSTSIGTSQTISLEPAVYSYDLDNVASPSSLTYTFYCRPVDSGVFGSYPTYPNASKMDVKNQQTLTAYSAGCFSGSSNIELSS